MKSGNASASTREAGFGDVAVVGGSGLVESVEIQGLLPCFTEEEQINVIVQQQLRYERGFVGEGTTVQECEGDGWGSRGEVAKVVEVGSAVSGGDRRARVRPE